MIEQKAEENAVTAMDHAFMEKLENERNTYGRNTSRFEAVMVFLHRYKNSETPLSEDQKFLFRECGGHPLQDVIYSTIIYDLPVERWESFSEQKRYERLYNCGAELYHYQRMLNICIGRTYYDSRAKDTTLLWHIKDEIVSRFDFIKGDFKAMEKSGINWTDEAFGRYTGYYLKNYALDTGLRGAGGEQFVMAVQWYFQRHKSGDDHFIKDDKSFWLSLTGKRTKSNVTLFTKVMRDAYGRRLYPTKDDLFVFAIAVRLYEEEFRDLIGKARQDCGDPNRYEYNRTNIRDALLLSVISNIDEWYKSTAAALSDCEDYFPRKTIDEKSIYFAMELFFRIDKMLWDNLYHHGEVPPADQLLFHNFLLDRGDQLYSRRFKEWLEEHHDHSTIIEFQESVKKDLRDARKKEITADYAES